MRSSPAVLGTKQLATLTELLVKHNGTRKVRLLQPAQIYDAIAAALADPNGVGIVHGGEANDGLQRTTLCLAYRHGAKLTVGVGTSRARSAGPGVTWKKLQPWSNVRPETNRDRLVAWATTKQADRVTFPVGKGVALALPDQDALVAAVISDPDDDAARTVYADKLLELGDPRGEYIAVALALARAKAGSKRHRALAKQVATLEHQHAAGWSRAIAQYSFKQRYRRGFVEHVELRGAAFASHAAALFAAAPVESVKLRNLDTATLRKVAAQPALAKLRALELDGPVGDAGAVALAKGSLANLRELRIDGCGIAVRGVTALVQAAPRLERLVVQALGEPVAAVLVLHPRVTVLSYTKPRRGPAVTTLERAGRIQLLRR